MKIPIYKVFINAKTGEIIQEIWKENGKDSGNRGCIFLFNNLELTDEKHKKGMRSQDIWKSWGTGKKK